MSIFIPDIWTWICVALGIMLITSLIMNAQEKYFFTKDVILRKFSIMDLEFASKDIEILNIVKGMYLLPKDKSKKVVNTLKSQLIVDFIFMPAVYGLIFLLCIKVSSKMSSDIGQYFFAALGWLQVLPFVFDIYENIYLLNKVKAHSSTSSEADVKLNKKQAQENTHKFFQSLVALKWGISLLGAVCSIAALCFFWLAGFYSKETLPYIVIIIVEIVVFFVAGKLISKRLKTVIPE